VNAKKCYDDYRGGKRLSMREARMKKRIARVSPAFIAILLILSVSIPFQNTNALQQSVPAVVKLADGDPYFLGALDGELYYKYQSQLWKTDGTTAGTSLLTAAVPLGPHFDDSDAAAFPFYPKHYPKGAASNGLFFFSADDDVHGQELWRSDGTAAGTFMLKDIAGSGPSNPENFIDVNGIVFFKTGDVCYPACDLWRSDGTPTGTFFIKAITLAYDNATQMRAAGINGLLLFESGADLWRSDGTVAGTTLIQTGADLLDKSGQQVYFRKTGTNSLWATDGAGTLQLTDFPILFHACISGSCYFSEQTAGGADGIWKTDGTPAGTIKLVDVLIEYPRVQLADVNGMVYIAVGNEKSELWKTNGTPGGTKLVRDNLPEVSDLTSAYGHLYFVADDETGFGQLWKSDGTSAQTGAVTKIGNGQDVLEIFRLNENMLLRVGEGLMFPPGQYTTYQTWHLYESDGTQAGTVRVAHADFAREVISCPTPLCWATILYQEQSIQVGGKWYFGDADPVSREPGLWMADHIYFTDVLPDHWAFPWIERLAEAEITAGCSLKMYCPETQVTRAQIAVFLERGIHGSSYAPPAATGLVFDDVPASHWASTWIERLAADGITAGCGGGNYCPEDSVTRAQMAVFLLRAEHGIAYRPPAVGASTGFGDVATNYWAAAWIKQLAAEGITGGCGTGIYCPESPVTRAQMAVFLVKTFNLP